MYANNLFTLNNISTLSAVQGGFGVDNRSESEYAVGMGDRLFVTVVQCGRTVFDSVSTSATAPVAGRAAAACASTPRACACL